MLVEDLRTESEYLRGKLERARRSIKGLIQESEDMQLKLLDVVGRPSSHVVGRIKALNDALFCLDAD